MLYKRAHVAYNVSKKAFLKNFDYVMKYAEEQGLVINLKQRGQIVATILTSSVGDNLTDFVDKLEEQHQIDHSLIKQLKNENKVLKLKMAITDSLNHDQK